MKIAAVTTFKLGVLYKALQQLGWTQAELARRTGIHQARISKIINIAIRIREDEANLIQAALAEQGILIDPMEEWPAGFRGFGKRFEVSQIAEVPVESLTDCIEAAEITDGSYERQQDELNYEGLREAMETLTEREREVLRLRFWDGETLEAAARPFRITRESLRKLEEKAIRKLRHPARMKMICMA